MSLAAPAGPPPPGCNDSMLLPPQTAGIRLRCARPAGHEGLHGATDSGGTQRRWPQATPDPGRSEREARLAADARPSGPRAL